MPHYLGRFQGAAMAHIEAFGARAYQAFQFAGDRKRVVLEWGTFRAACQRDAAEQNSRRDEIAHQSVLGR